MGTAAWTIVSNRDERAPVLPLNGRRSILAPWPAGSFCTECGTIAEEGYVGPVDGRRAFFPDPRLVLLCRSCAVEAVGVEEEGLFRHQCCGGCRDRLHVELLPKDDSVMASYERCDRVAAVRGRYLGTPWSVLDVSAVDLTLAMECGVLSSTVSGLMAVWLEIDPPLVWPDPRRY